MANDMCDLPKQAHAAHSASYGSLAHLARRSKRQLACCPIRDSMPACHRRNPPHPWRPRKPGHNAGARAVSTAQAGGTGLTAVLVELVSASALVSASEDQLHAADTGCAHGNMSGTMLATSAPIRSHIHIERSAAAMAAAGGVRSGGYRSSSRFSLS